MLQRNLEQAGKKLGVDLLGKHRGLWEFKIKPEQIDKADYIVIAADVIEEASRFGNKKLYVTSLEDAIVHPEQILESLTTKSYFIRMQLYRIRRFLARKAITFMILMVTNVVVFSNICDDDQIKI